MSKNLPGYCVACAILIVVGAAFYGVPKIIPNEGPRHVLTGAMWTGAFFFLILIIVQLNKNKRTLQIEEIPQHDKDKTNRDEQSEFLNVEEVNPIERTHHVSPVPEKGIRLD